MLYIKEWVFPMTMCTAAAQCPAYKTAANTCLVQYQKGTQWVSSFCTQAEFVMKADDDIYLDLYGLYTVASRYVDDKVNLKTVKHTIT